MRTHFSIQLLASITLTLISSLAGAETRLSGYFAQFDESFLLDQFRREAVNFDWVKIYDQPQFDVPSYLAHIKKVKAVDENSPFILLRSQEGVDQLNSLIESGVELFMDFRREMYSAMTIGPGDGESDYRAISNAIQKPDNKSPVMVITPQSTADVIDHENVHARQQSSGFTVNLKARLYDIAGKHGLTEADSSLVSGIFSAIIEIPAYEEQYHFLQTSPYYADPSKTDAIYDGNDLVVLSRPELKKALLDQSNLANGSAAIFMQLMGTNNYLESKKSSAPALFKDLCSILDTEIANGILFKKKAIFPACFGST